jgi:flagellar biosynthetic protein FliR
MTVALAELLPLISSGLWHGITVFLRVAVLASFVPAFGEQSVPMRIKLMLALAFTLITAPAIAPTSLAPSLESILWLAVTETVAGLILGLGLRMFILGLQTAGSIAAQSTSLSQILGGAVADPLPAMGYALIVAGLALAVMSGVHVHAAELVILSYNPLPIGNLPDAAAVSRWGLDQTRHAFSLAFTLAAPFVILSVLYNLALGAINKAMPQLMVAFVGAPVITAAGVILLFLAAPMMLSVWMTSLEHYLANPFSVRK